MVTTMLKQVGHAPEVNYEARALDEDSSNFMHINTMLTICLTK